jgi:beta-lactamase superfamily II metal-dependent hydrolase
MTQHAPGRRPQVRPRPAAPAVAAATLVLVALLAPVAPAAAQYLEIHYPDIEQGASTLVIGPTGKGLLVDAGSELNPADDDIVLFLRDLQDRGILTSLDYVVATHYDEDHIGRLEHALLQGGVSGSIVTYDRGTFGGTPSTFAYWDYKDAADLNNRTTITPTTDIDLGGGVTVECWAVNGSLRDTSTVDISGSGQFENSASVALVVRYGDFDAWIGGDLTGNPDVGVTDVEGPVGALVGDLDLYTFDHHGSRTSSDPDFLAEITPEVGIAQMAVTNSFGHPNTEAVEGFLGTLDTDGNTPLFFQQNPGNPGDVRSDDDLADGIADPDDVDDVVGLPGTIVVRSDGESWQLFGGMIEPVARLADSGTGSVGDYPPAVLRVGRSPLVPTDAQSVAVTAHVADEGTPSVALRWWLDGSEQTALTMSSAGGTAYQATIPAQDDGTKVVYRVEATDSGSQVGSSAAWGYFAGTTTVATLRDNDADGALVPLRYDVRIEGAITAEPGIFHPFVSQIYVEDATGGVQVFDRTLLSLDRGDQVELVGRLEQFAGQTEVNISQDFGNYGHTFVSSGSEPTPTTVTVADLLSDPEDYEGLLIAIEDLEVVLGTIPESGGGNLTVSDDNGTSTITLRIDEDTDLPGAPTPTQPFDLVAIASQFDAEFPFTSGYQIVPRGRADFDSVEVNLPALLIHEIHADPASGSPGDANGDGTRDAEDDELIELVNTGYVPLDISGWTLSDALATRHTFAASTVIPPREAVVVFGAGTPTGAFGNAAANGLVFTASSGGLSLNNTGDTVTLKNASAAVVQSVTYGNEANHDESITRDPDWTNTPFARHSQLTASGGAKWSPGERTSGATFTVPVGAIVLSEVMYDPSGADGGLEWIEIYNASAATIDLSGLSIGAGGGDYTNTQVQLEGTVDAGETFVVGGPTSSSDNANPTFDLELDWSPDLQNSGSVADGVALFNLRAAFVTATTVPIDAVVYGTTNSDGLIDETGSASSPEVGDAPGGSSIERTTLGGSWQIQSSPTPNAEGF